MAVNSYGELAASLVGAAVRAAVTSGAARRTVAAAAAAVASSALAALPATTTRLAPGEPSVTSAGRSGKKRRKKKVVSETGSHPGGAAEPVTLAAHGGDPPGVTSCQPRMQVPAVLDPASVCHPVLPHPVNAVLADHDSHPVDPEPGVTGQASAELANNAGLWATHRVCEQVAPALSAKSPFDAEVSPTPVDNPFMVLCDSCWEPLPVGFMHSSMHYCFCSRCSSIYVGRPLLSHQNELFAILEDVSRQASLALNEGIFSSNWRPETSAGFNLGVTSSRSRFPGKRYAASDRWRTSLKQ